MQGSAVYEAAGGTNGWRDRVEIYPVFFESPDEKDVLSF